VGRLSERQATYLQNVYRLGGSTVDPVSLLRLGQEKGWTLEEARESAVELIEEELLVHVPPEWLLLTPKGLALAKRGEEVEPASTNRVFVSYSHKDRRWLEALLLHLAPLQLAGLLEAWHDRKIGVGSDWLAAILSALGSARVAVLLVSPDFLGSEFILKEELPRLFAAQKQGRTVILPLLCRPSATGLVPDLHRIQVANPGLKPLSVMKSLEREKLFADVAMEIHRLLPSTGVS
jgi:TIR domain